MNSTSIFRSIPSRAGLAAIALAIASASMSAWGQSPPTPASAEAYRGILTYPERMKPVGKNSDARDWFDPATDFTKYKRFAIERIQVKLDPKSASVDPNDLKAMTDYFQQAVTKALVPKYPVVNEVGDDVLRVRITLVGLVGTKTGVSAAVLVIPFATLPDMAVTAASGRPTGAAPYLGTTKIAVEFIDGGTNAVVGQYAAENFGRKYVVDTGDAGKTISGTIGGTTKSLSTWAYAQQAFDGWALLFRQWLDQGRLNR